MTPTPSSAYEGISHSTPLGDTFQLIGVVLLMVAIVAGAYFLTRLVAGGSLRMQKRLAKMQVVDRLMLARDRAAVVIELDGRYFLIGVGDAVSMLCEVDGEIYRREAEPVRSAGFMSALKDKLAGAGADDTPFRVGDAQELERAVERLRRQQKGKEDERDGGQ